MLARFSPATCALLSLVMRDPRTPVTGRRALAVFTLSLVQLGKKTGALPTALATRQYSRTRNPTLPICDIDVLVEEATA